MSVDLFGILAGLPLRGDSGGLRVAKNYDLETGHAFACSCYSAHHQSLVVANSPRAAEDQNFIDSVSDWDGASGSSNMARLRAALIL